MPKKEKAIGMLAGNKVIVKDESQTNRLFNKGRFGKIINQTLELGLVEALYLYDKGDLILKSMAGRKLSEQGFIRKASKVEPRFWTRYKVYQDIRKRGYITKTALKYGADFRIYNRGTVPGEAHAKWVLYAVSEGESFDWRKFASMQRVAHSVRKKLLIGVVDEEGDVTYYESRWVRP